MVRFLFLGIKKSPVEGRGNLMFSQRNNPYCDLLLLVQQMYGFLFGNPNIIE